MSDAEILPPDHPLPPLSAGSPEGKPLAGRIALVTGAGHGIGRAVAPLLARAGAHVVAVSRPQSKAALEELDDEITEATGDSATLVPLDIKDYGGIDNLGAGLYERFGKLDILVANAGLLGPLSPVGHYTPKEWDDVVAVNFTANYRLIRSMDPLLRLSDAARAVFVTSGATQKNRAYWAGYAATKAALEKLVLTYAEEVAEKPMAVNLIDPGATATHMRRAAFPGEDPATLPTAADVARLYLAMVRPEFTQSGTRLRYRDWAAQAG
ncbi:oxidoreductase [Rhodothalassium salexigens]|uniref:SDR family NAD(P)-dependent oxidoreductase n=1 Tax=Rhodothalassium salexigens TaxID=1086 RepID=UPI0019120D2E|nr:SDR family NAD(P)-dependent oxidoreductase [Rhodothalassium salexigens]MBK5912494.1 oxidoreductase [Rhodothalassium salexigens]